MLNANATKLCPYILFQTYASIIIMGQSLDKSVPMHCVSSIKINIKFSYRTGIVTMAKHNAIEKDGHSGSFQNLNYLSMR